MSRLKISLICVGVTLVHLATTLFAVLGEQFFPSLGAQPAFRTVSRRVGDVMLQPAAALWEPSADSSLTLGIVILVANSLLWAIAVTGLLVFLISVKERRRATF